MRFIQFIGDPTTLYKVIKEHKNYILYYDPSLNDLVWERTEYIDKEIEIDERAFKEGEWHK